jgi:hypothetical protein
MGWATLWAILSQTHLVTLVSVKYNFVLKFLQPTYLTTKYLLTYIGTYAMRFKGVSRDPKFSVCKKKGTNLLGTNNLHCHDRKSAKEAKNAAAEDPIDLLLWAALQ